MFDLVTDTKLNDDKKHFVGIIIDNDGLFKTFHYVLDGSYYYDQNTKREYDTYIQKFNNKIITIANVSKNYKLDKRILETDVLQIETDFDCFTDMRWNECVWGNNLMDCMHLGLRNGIYASIYEAGRQVPNMDTQLIHYVPPENTIPLRIVSLNDNGLNIVNGLVKYEYQEERSDTCPSCIQGMQSLEQTIEKIGKHIVANTKNARFNGSYIHDMDLSNDEAITNSLTEALQQTILLAKIKKIKFESI